MIIVTTVATEEEPLTPSPEPVPERQRLQFTWFGTDGSTWDLAEGPVRLAAGASGFALPQFTHWHHEAPALDGAVWRGLHVSPREVFLPMHVHGESSNDWLDVDRAFRASINPRSEGRLRVATPGATWRELALRYVEGGEGEFDIDPSLLRYAPYPLRFIAAEPYWTGEPVEVTFENPSPVALFPGPPFVLNKTQTLAAAKVTNPGEEDAYPVWRVNGPFTSFTLGAAGSDVSMTLTKSVGEWVEIDMHPQRLTIVDNAGANRWDDVTDATFAGIPPGLQPLTTTVAGSTSDTSIALSFTPRYQAAW